MLRLCVTLCPLAMLSLIINAFSLYVTDVNTATIQ
jgi:hypothetical protein